MNPPGPNLIASFSRALIKCQRGYLVVKIRWICCSTVDGALEERPLWDRVLPANSKPTIWLHTASPIYPIFNQTMDPDFPISSFLGERNRKNNAFFTGKIYLVSRCLCWLVVQHHSNHETSRIRGPICRWNFHLWSNPSFWWLSSPMFVSTKPFFAS